MVDHAEPAGVFGIGSKGGPKCEVLFLELDEHLQKLYEARDNALYRKNAEGKQV